MSQTTHIKFEQSPADSVADSFISTPGTVYPSLFPDAHPAEVMTPCSYEDEDMFGGSMCDGSLAGTPAPEKKPVKKRKSWGQQLPEPKTNLPPRKRAKTEDEKEQRRVERVLRNRRAAQSSRERKRQEVEALENEKRTIERRNLDLEMRLQAMEAKNLILQRQLEQLTGSVPGFHSSSVASSPGRSDQYRSQPTPITFSHDLFGARDQDSCATTRIPQTVMDAPAHLETVDPASLSPEIKPVVDSTSNASSSDMTQHPAAMLCDLQCQSEEQRPWMADSTSTRSAISQILATVLCINLASETISTLLTPLQQIITSLTQRSSLSPTTSILTTIIWLATTTACLTTSTSTTSSTKTTTSPRPRFSLRIRLLRRLLTCSPNLARPLMDATMVAMRSVSEQQLARDCPTGVDASHRLGCRDSPTVESLMTLLWAIKVIEKDRLRGNLKSDPGTGVGQMRGELDELLRQRDISTISYVSSASGREGIGGVGKKSWEDRCPAFEHDRA